MSVQYPANFKALCGMKPCTSSLQLSRIKCFSSVATQYSFSRCVMVFREYLIMYSLLHELKIIQYFPYCTLLIIPKSWTRKSIIRYEWINHRRKWGSLQYILCVYIWFTLTSKFKKKVLFCKYIYTKRRSFCVDKCSMYLAWLWKSSDTFGEKKNRIIQALLFHVYRTHSIELLARIECTLYNTVYTDLGTQYAFK